MSREQGQRPDTVIIKTPQNKVVRKSIYIQFTISRTPYSNLSGASHVRSVATAAIRLTAREAPHGRIAQGNTSVANAKEGKSR